MWCVWLWWVAVVVRWPAGRGAAIFPTPEEDKGQWEVQNEQTGKTTQIPHPVHALRVWNTATRSYDQLDPRLDGAPKSEAELEAWFRGVVVYLKANMLGKVHDDEQLVRSASAELDEQVSRNGHTSKWIEIVRSVQPPFLDGGGQHGGVRGTAEEAEI